MENLNIYIQQLISMGIEYLPKLLLAILTLLIGLWLIKFVVKGIDKLMSARDVDKSLQFFLKRLVQAALRVMLIIIVVSMVGIETTSLIAALGASVLAIGLALQGSLANFAGGVLILLLKPFKVDDFIEVEGYTGRVREIRIFYTIIVTPQNQVITIPNSGVSNNAVVNFTAEKTRRLDLVFGIGYEDSIDKAREVMKSIIDKEERILKTPAPTIDIEELADSSVNFKLKLWTNTEDYWSTNYFMHEEVKKQFDKNGISIPFPQRDVHLKQS